MICFRILYLTSLLLFGINISLWGYEKRELLQKEVTLDELNQPSSPNRSGLSIHPIPTVSNGMLF